MSYKANPKPTDQITRQLALLTLACGEGDMMRADDEIIEALRDLVSDDEESTLAVRVLNNSGARARRE